MTSSRSTDPAIVRFACHLRKSSKDREALLTLIGDGEDASVIADFARRRGFRVTPEDVSAVLNAVTEVEGRPECDQTP